jgi:hypothetical protein
VVYIDSAISSTLQGGLTTFKGDLLTQFNYILPLALGVIVTVTVVFMAIHWFGKLTGAK